MKNTPQQPTRDHFLDRIDQWKKRSIAIFAFASLILAMAVVLVIEAKGIADAAGMK